MKAPDSAIQRAEIAVENGSTWRAEAVGLGISHVALLKRVARMREHGSDLDGFGQFDETEVAIVVAVARASIPRGLAVLARYMECELSELVEVARECG